MIEELDEEIPDGWVETLRLEAFSDAVFAVAITLLVLDLRPPAGEGDLTRKLLDLWPNYAAYTVSFMVIGVIWVNHHDVFSRIKFVDRRLKFINLILLMTTALIPFPTALVAEHLGEDGSHVAAVVYGIVMTAMGLSFLALWAYVARNPRLLAPPHDADYAWKRFRRTVMGPIVYAIAALVGLLNAYVSLALFGFVTVYFALSRSAS